LKEEQDDMDQWSEFRSMARFRRLLERREVLAWTGRLSPVDLSVSVPRNWGRA